MGKIKDITGSRFGRLTAISYVGSNSEGKALWRCKCDCGNYTTVIGKLLRNGHTRSCGCLCKEATSLASLNDLTGMRFEKLTVISRAEDYVSPGRKKHHVRWNCICDCGNTTVVSAGQLTRGKTRSCGCLKVGNVKHGGSHDRLYKVYYNMRDRCCNKNTSSYKYYGGRGISICEEWLRSYESFKEWAYEAGYDETAAYGDCTIDRIDVNGNYCPENCRWVNMVVQSANRRNVINKKNDQCPRKDNTGIKAEIS